MKFQAILSVLAMAGLSFFFACGNDQSVRDEAVQNVTPADGGSGDVQLQTTTPAAAPEPAQNAQGVWHYTCPNGHEGGSGKAEACSVCGTMMAHNAAYHTPAEGAGQPLQLTDPATSATPAEPAQNAAGVWHYTCPNGCEGGAGVAGTCPKCGGALAHNQAYHQ